MLLKKITPVLNRTSVKYLLLITWLTLSLMLTGCKQQENKPGRTQETGEPEYRGTIIAVGDSLTAGLGVAHNDAWPFLVEQRLQKEGYEWEVINAGISGETSSGALSRIRWILARKPEIVILETGANDGLRGIPVPVIRENINKAVRMLKEKNVTVILAGMQIVQNLGADYSSNFSRIYPEIARENDIILIPFLLQGVAAEPSLNQADSIHPNEQGHKMIAGTVYPYVLRGIEHRQ